MVSAEDEVPQQEDIDSPTAKNDEIGTLQLESTSPTTKARTTTTATASAEDKSGNQSQPHGEIEYRYLTFDTSLPSPTDVSIEKPGRPSPPECPDLRQYVSPFQWPSKRKAMITLISSTATLLASYSAGSHAPAQDQLVPYFNISPVVFNLGITTYTFGFAVAPMMTAPFSEINGRRPIIVCSGLLFMGKLRLIVPDSYRLHL